MANSAANFIRTFSLQPTVIEYGTNGAAISAASKYDGRFQLNRLKTGDESQKLYAGQHLLSLTVIIQMSILLLSHTVPQC